MNVLSQRSGLLHVDPDFGAHETAIQYREFYEYYLNELKRCALQIMRKIEFPMGAYAIISPTPLPFTIQKQLEELSIKNTNDQVKIPNNAISVMEFIRNS